jgi:hypothetical protein
VAWQVFGLYGEYHGDKQPMAKYPQSHAEARPCKSTIKGSKDLHQFGGFYLDMRHRSQVVSQYCTL